MLKAINISHVWVLDQQEALDFYVGKLGLELDTEPREVTVPADLAAALEGDAAAKRFFDGLSYSRRSWHVLQVEGTKNPETRRRRIEKSVQMCREGKAP